MLEINCKQMHRHTDRLTHRQTDEHKKEKIQKTNTIVNAGPTDIEYLYYPINLEGVTLKGSLLPASTR